MEQANPSLLERALSLVGLQKRVAEDPGLISMTGVAGASYGQPPPYDIRTTYSALARFPWVWSCAQAIQTDLGSLPLKASRATADGRGSVSDHPALDLLRRPVASGRLAGITLRAQIALDFAVSRNAYIMVDDPSTPRSIVRVHPESVRVVPDAAYLPTAYMVGRDIVQRVPWQQMIHIRGTSWLDGPEQVYGTSPIQVLEMLLNVEWDAMNNARKASKRGRPDAVMSPPDGTIWTAEQGKKIQGWIDNWTSSRAGMLINPWGAKISTLSQNLREMEFLGTLDRGTSATLAVFGVTPTRVGIQSANYATAQIETLINWSNRQGDAAVIDAGYSVLAERLGQPGDRIEHDFSGVPALQRSRGEALQRVSVHIINGIAPADAYRLEGLDTAAEMAQAATAAATATPARAIPRREAKRDRYLNAAVEHLRLIATDGLGAEDVPELIRTLEASQ